MQEQAEDSVYKIELLPNKIVRCEFTHDFYYSCDLAWKLYDACNALTDNTSYKMLWLMHTRLQPQKELFDFYANKKRAEVIIAESFCLNSTALRMMANFYFRIKSPAMPSKVFDSEPEAIKWLNTFGN